tara:strand:- start:198 stop:578 length:381 start_codon:yes stop_codon:yes gene_type:complete
MKIDHTYIRDLILEELNALCEKSPGEHPYTVNFLQPGAPGVTASRRRAIVDAVSEDEAISKFKDRFPDAQRIVISEARSRYRLQDIIQAKDNNPPESFGEVVGPALDKLEEDLLKLIDALPKMLKP